MTKKVNSDIFCERSGTCIMKSYNNGEDVIIIVKDLHTDPVTILKQKINQKNLTEEEKSGCRQRDQKRGDQVLHQRTKNSQVNHDKII